MIALNEVGRHAIQGLRADYQDDRSYMVAVLCRCSAEFPGNRSATYSGVLDVAVQVFFTHLASVGEIE